MATVYQVCLIAPSSTRFRVWCRRQRQFHKANRPRDPFARDYQADLCRLEIAFRHLLAKGVPSPEERILSYSECASRGRDIERYHEIDHVIGTGDKPLVFVELKFLERMKPKLAGAGQLNASLSVARVRWPSLRGMLVHVHLGRVFSLGEQETSKYTGIDQLPDLCMRQDKERMHVCVEGQEFLDQAIGAGCWDAQSTERLIEGRLNSMNPLRILKDDQPDDRPLGNAFSGLSGSREGDGITSG